MYSMHAQCDSVFNLSQMNLPNLVLPHSVPAVCMYNSCDVAEYHSAQWSEGCSSQLAWPSKGKENRFSEIHCCHYSSKCLQILFTQ